MALGIWVVAYHQGLVKRQREFLVYFPSFTEEKNITNVLAKIMVKSCGVLQLQFIKANGDYARRDVKLVYSTVFAYRQGRVL